MEEAQGSWMKVLKRNEWILNLGCFWNFCRSRSRSRSPLPSVSDFSSYTCCVILFYLLLIVNEWLKKISIVFYKKYCCSDGQKRISKSPKKQSVSRSPSVSRSRSRSKSLSRSHSLPLYFLSCSNCKLI